MRPWTFRATRWVMAVAGAVTLVLSFLLMGYGREGLFSEIPDFGNLVLFLALAAVPWALLLAAGAIRRESPGVQRFVAVAAVIIAVVIDGSIGFELSQPYSQSRNAPVGTGTLSILAWVAGTIGAIAVLLVAVGAVLWDQAGKDEWPTERGVARTPGPPAAAGRGVLVACCAVGTVSGARSGYLHAGLGDAIPLAVAGMVLGFLIGAGSFYALVSPFGRRPARTERRRP